MSEKASSRLMFLFAAAMVIVIGLGAGLYVWTGVLKQPFPGTITDPGVEQEDPDPVAGLMFHEIGGTMDVDVAFVWSYDDSDIGDTTGTPNATSLYHADRDTLSATYGTTNDDIQAKLWIEDAGILWLVVDLETSTTYYVDDYRTLKNNADLISTEGWDYDDDGTVEVAFKYDVTHFAALTAGETTKNDKLNIYLVKYDSSPALTSSANVTSISTTQYLDYYNELYVSGWTGQGYAIKLNRMQITFDLGNTTLGERVANATYVEDGYAVLRDVKVTYDSSNLRTQTYSGGEIVWSYSSRRYEINLGVGNDLNNEYYALMMMQDRGLGSTFAKVNLHWQAKFPAGSKTIYATVKFYYINPASTPASFTKAISLAS